MRPLLEMRGHERVVRGLQIDSSGRRIASIDEQTIFLWNASTGRAEKRWNAPSGSFSSVNFAPDGESLITAGNSMHSPSELRLWNLRDGTNRIFLRQSTRITAIAGSTVGEWVVADDRGTIQIWPAFAWSSGLSG